MGCGGLIREYLENYGLAARQLATAFFTCGVSRSANRWPSSKPAPDDVDVAWTGGCCASLIVSDRHPMAGVSTGIYDVDSTGVCFAAGRVVGENRIRKT